MNTSWIRAEEKHAHTTLYFAYNKETGRLVVMGDGKVGRNNFKKFVERTN